jgi:hypothetical protein
MPFTPSVLSLMSRSFAIALLLMVPQLGRAETGPLLVELNKMEEKDGGGCRAFLLFRLASLDGEGVIDRLLSVDASPLPVQRTTLKLFEVPEISCSNISEILLHDVTSCQPQNEAQMDCFPILTLGSRAAAQLVK